MNPDSEVPTGAGFSAFVVGIGAGVDEGVGVGSSTPVGAGDGVSVGTSGIGVSTGGAG